MRKINLKENDLVSIIKKILNEQKINTNISTEPAKHGCGYRQIPCGGGCCDTGGTYHTTCVNGMCRDSSVGKPSK